MSKWKNKFNWEKIKGDIEKEKESKQRNYNDDRLFKPDWKAAIEKNKFYTFRFLPDQDGTPFSHYYHHAFSYPDSDGTGKKWYFNNCISTFGWDPKCPICAKNSEYYNSAFESDKKMAEIRGRKQSWVSNILMINDPINPENNGEIFLYKYGYKIYQKIEKQMFPSEVDLEDDDFEAFVPFDLFGGANFKLKIKMQGEYPNYDDSSWSKVAPVAGGTDEEIDKIMEKVHSLVEFTDPKNYPTVDETIGQIGHLLGIASVEGEDEEDEASLPDETPKTPNPVEEPAESPKEPAEDKMAELGEKPTNNLDDDEEFFKNL